MTARDRPGGRKSRSSSTPPQAGSGADVVASASATAAVAAELAQHELIAFDTEFLRERTFYPQLGLLQIAHREKAWLIDPLAVSPADMQPLIEVLTDPKILKAAHSAEQDQECLHRVYGVTAAPLLDTSIAAALTGRGDQIGLAPLLRKTLKVDLPKGHTRTNWLKRPLPEAMAVYAASDVADLVELAELLLADLERRGRRDWALALSAELAEPNRYQTDGTAIAAKLAAGSRLSARGYATLIELVRWREERVRKADVPRRWLAEDQALMQIARARPKQAEELGHFRGLGQRVRDYGPAQILEALDRADAIPDKDLASPPQKPEPSSAETAALGVLKCFLNSLAQENDVPLRYLIGADTPLLLLRGNFDSLEDLRRSGLLGEGALEIFGADVLAILQGRRALKLEAGKARHFDL